MANRFGAKKSLRVGSTDYTYIDLSILDKALGGGIRRLPRSLQILAENVARHDDGSEQVEKALNAIKAWDPKQKSEQEIAFTPARVVLQDFTGVPAVVDLAAMRDACADMGGDANKINPQLPAQLVIDHSVQVDVFARRDAFRLNVKREYERNRERYAFLRWGQKAFQDFSVVPPGTGIVHQVNLEYLGQVVFSRQVENELFAYPDTLVGTDSHTTMINGLGVLGWGVGGIEAEAAMLGQPISLLIPEVVGFELKGTLPEGATATDLVLTVTQMLRERGVVGKFVEFFGSGLAHMSVADRATISNMAPEYGATCGLFPVDESTLNYLKFTNRDTKQIALVESYAKTQNLFGREHTAEYSDSMSLDLGDVKPSLAGPRRPQDRFLLEEAKKEFNREFAEAGKKRGFENKKHKSITMSGERFDLSDGAVVIAAITSCTNTSNPSVMLGAGLIAKKAAERGLKRKPWVKTSFAPGSKVVTDYLVEADLMKPLEALGFYLVGYGCTTCIGNSGPLPEEIESAIVEENLVACSVLSGNRNFEGRIHPHVRFSYLASPPLVVAYALTGSLDHDFAKDPIGQDQNGKDIFLRDLWPSQKEIENAVKAAVKPEMFSHQYAKVFDGDDTWKSLPVPEGNRFAWEKESTYIKQPSFFDGMSKEPQPIQPIENMSVLLKLGDSVTTDHISPAGAIPKGSPAEQYLESHGVARQDFNSFGSRRGNHEVMTRGTFGNIRLRNQLVPGVEGGFTRHPSSSEPISVFDAAMKYQADNTPLIVLAGKEYGSGSSRDWAAKGTRLLGVHVVLAESFERIHRSNLIGMGVLPLQYERGENADSLGLTGEETFSLKTLGDGLTPQALLPVTVTRKHGETMQFNAVCRIDTPGELTYYRNGGILHYVLRRLTFS